jgi:hypothetical protein
LFRKSNGIIAKVGDVTHLDNLEVIAREEQTFVNPRSCRLPSRALSNAVSLTAGFRQPKSDRPKPTMSTADDQLSLVKLRIFHGIFWI